jgi:hypothetical protein
MPEHCVRYVDTEMKISVLSNYWPETLNTPSQEKTIMATKNETKITVEPTKPWLLQRLEYTDMTWACNTEDRQKKMLADIDVAHTIQILTENDNNLRELFRQTLNFSYAGSAEFEFGAIPKCMELFRATKQDHVHITLEVAIADKNDKRVTETFYMFGPCQTIHTMQYALLQELWTKFSPTGCGTLATLRFKARSGIGDSTSGLYVSQGFNNGWEFDHYKGPKSSDQVGVLDLDNACFCFWDRHVSECTQKINYGDHVIPRIKAENINITKSINGYATLEDNQKAVAYLLKTK